MSALQTGGGASPPSFERSLLPGTPFQQRGATYQTYLEGRGGEYIHTEYIHTDQNAFSVNRDKRVYKSAK